MSTSLRPVHAADPPEIRTSGNRLWNRELNHYPSNGRRSFYLGVVILATITLYYELYVGGAVGTQIISDLDMSFQYFIGISIVANAVGALASLGAGLADRWGRANLVAVGLVLSGLLMLIGLPNASSKTEFLVLFVLLGIVEGVTLVATPALIRDFSPQLGRASAMGFWTMGPVLGSILVTQISSNSLDAHPDWQYHFRLCGVIGLVVAAIAVLSLRELSPRLRDQIMVSLRDKELIEARAAGIDEELVHRGQWRQLLRLDVIGSAFAVSMLLLFYYVAVGFLVIYFEITFGYTAARANDLANWLWISMAISLLVSGAVSDLLKVRKPFMVVGCLISATGVGLFATYATQPETSYATFAWTFVVIGVGLGIAYSTWMAAFTETVERHNPAATATGLAMWASILRTVVVLSLIGFLVLVSAANTLIEHGPRVSGLAETHAAELATLQKIDGRTLDRLEVDPEDPAAQVAAVSSISGLPAEEVVAVQSLSQKYAAEIQTLQALDPATLQALSANPADPAAGAKAMGELVAALGLTPEQAQARLGAVASAPRGDLETLQTKGPVLQAAVAELTAVGEVPKADLDYLSAHGEEVQQAAVDSSQQWERWWWIAFAGQLLFLPFILVMGGRWSPRRAREDAARHEELVARELAALCKGADK